MWSAQWVLSRALGRPDAFPVGDLALKRIVSQLYFGGESMTDAELGDFSQRWSPFRSLATSYLFAALKTGRGQEVTATGQRIYAPG
jgi:DNA-3-methyladenine glycosylase II